MYLSESLVFLSMPSHTRERALEPPPTAPPAPLLSPYPHFIHFHPLRESVMKSRA